MIRRLACLAAGLLPVISQGAESAARTPWSTQSSVEKCSLLGALTEASGRKTAASVELNWTRSSGHWLTLTLGESVPVGPWTLDTTARAGGLRILSGGARSRYTGARIDTAEQLVRELSAGSALLLAVGHGATASRYTTRGDASAPARTFQECVSHLQASPAPQQPPPRWNVELTGRNCSLNAAMPDVPGARISFLVSKKSTPLFYAATFQKPDGGVLRVELPGLQPWIIDTEKIQASADARETLLLEALIGRKTVPMTFTPRGAQSIAFQAPLGNIEVAGPMFRECMNALKAPDLPPQLSLTELNYSVSESGKSCELSGTFQIEGNAIWLVLSTGEGRNAIKITRRMVKAGRPIESLDLGGLGGPRDFRGQDAEYDLDAAAFAALRRDLAARGRDFSMRMNRVDVFVGQFGGRFAAVQAPMFNACVEAKSSR